MKLLTCSLSWVLLLAAFEAAATAQTEQTHAQPGAAADTRDEAREREETRERDQTRRGESTRARAEPNSKQDEEDSNDQKNKESGKLALTASQQEAVGIRIGRRGH